MSVSLSQGEALVRKRTRHNNPADLRADTADIRGELNRACQDLRLELQEIAPQLYVKTSDDLTLPEGQDNTIELDETECGQVSAIYRVDQFYSSPSPGVWRQVDRADEVDPSQSPSGNVNFYRKGRCIILGPDTYAGGTYRVLFWVVPKVLDGSDANALFLLPDALDQALIFKASGYIFFNDGDHAESEKCEARAEAIVKKASPMLRAQYGVHQKRAGLRIVR